MVIFGWIYVSCCGYVWLYCGIDVGVFNLILCLDYMVWEKVDLVILYCGDVVFDVIYIICWVGCIGNCSIVIVVVDVKYDVFLLLL